MARISRKNGMHMAMWSGVARAHHGSHLGVAMARGRERGRTEDSALENPRKVTRSAGNSCNPISGGLGRSGANRTAGERKPTPGIENPRKVTRSVLGVEGLG